MANILYYPIVLVSFFFIFETSCICVITKATSYSLQRESWNLLSIIKKKVIVDSTVVLKYAMMYASRSFRPHAGHGIFVWTKLPLLCELCFPILVLLRWSR
jgi:hypothetical protein